MAHPSNLPPIIIRRRKKSHDHPHSSSWKVALADFMTSMFIIFLMLWLIAQTTPEVRTGIADYFSPSTVSRNTSGSGGILGGQTMTVDGALRNMAAPLGRPGGGPSSPQAGEGNTEVPGFPGVTDKKMKDGIEPGSKFGVKPTRLDNDVQQQMSTAIKSAIQTNPLLQGFQNNVVLEGTPEGLRIEIVDSDQRELFRSGSATPLPHTAELMKAVAGVVNQVPNKLTLTGHTDNKAFGNKSPYSNWELSADRANASRRLLVAGGIAEERFTQVSGVADREPLLPNDPSQARNRRISMMVLNEPPPPEASLRLPPVPPEAAPPGRLIPR